MQNAIGIYGKIYLILIHNKFSFYPYQNIELLQK